MVGTLAMSTEAGMKAPTNTLSAGTALTWGSEGGAVGRCRAS